MPISKMVTNERREGRLVIRRGSSLDAQLDRSWRIEGTVKQLQDEHRNTARRLYAGNGAFGGARGWAEWDVRGVRNHVPTHKVPQTSHPWQMQLCGKRKQERANGPPRIKARGRQEDRKDGVRGCTMTCMGTLTSGLDLGGHQRWHATVK